MDREKRKGSVYLWILLVILFLPLLIILYLILSYNSWKKDFENTIPDGEMITVVEENKINELENRIDENSSSQNDIIILELSIKEVSELLLNTFQGNDSLKIVSVYIDPIEKGRWNIYLKVKVLDKESVWIKIEMRKEERETAELFIEDIFIGQYSFSSLGFKKLVSDINESLSSALINVEENGFVGRTFENMELLETGLVIRFEKY